MYCRRTRIANKITNNIQEEQYYIIYTCLPIYVYTDDQKHSLTNFKDTVRSMKVKWNVCIQNECRGTYGWRQINSLKPIDDGRRIQQIIDNILYVYVRVCYNTYCITCIYHYSCTGRSFYNEIWWENINALVPVAYTEGKLERHPKYLPIHRYLFNYYIFTF